MLGSWAERTDLLLALRAGSGRLCGVGVGVGRCLTATDARTGGNRVRARFLPSMLVAACFNDQNVVLTGENMPVPHALRCEVTASPRMWPGASVARSRDCRRP